MLSNSFKPFNPVAMYTSRSLTKASYKNGARRCNCPMINRTFSFVFIVSTNDVSSSLNCSSERSFAASEDEEPAIRSATPSLTGSMPCIVRSSSESGLRNAFKSVLARPSVTRRSVTSTSRSPRTMSAPIFFPSLTAVTNSSPESKPAESSREYKPLICLPTAAVAAFMMGLFISFLVAGEIAVGGIASPGEEEEDDEVSTMPPSPGTAEICGTIMFDARVGAGVSESPWNFCARLPVPETRLGSNSIKTPLGFVSRTSCPASAALVLDMWAVPSR
mmetsp:Transcript_9115/g.19731  ORF Transcript_9115/g.19731 Transcript_9115/m.19731 type:complete len:276 (+) Transcript_9115:2496-3323(+)